MPLDTQKVQLPFGQGLNQEVAEALVPTGKLHVAEQAWIEKQGSIQPRPGTDKLGDNVIGATVWATRAGTQAARFNGATYLSWAGAASAGLNFEYTTKWAVSFWYKSVGSGGTTTLLQRYLAPNGWSIRTFAGQLFIGRYTNAGNTAHTFFDSTMDNWGWHHIVLSIDSPTVVRAWMDKLPMTELPVFGGPLGATMQSAMATLELGGVDDGGGGTYDGFTGLLDDVVVFSGSVDEEDVKALYNGGLPGGVESYPKNTVLARILFEGDGLFDYAYNMGSAALVGPLTLDDDNMQTGVLDNPLHVLPDRDETVVVTDRHVLTSTPGAEAWRRVDNSYEANIHSVMRAERSAESMRNAIATYSVPVDHCVVGKMCLVAWNERYQADPEPALPANRINMRWIDMETGAKFDAATSQPFPANNIAPTVRCVGIWPYAYVVFAHIVDTQIRAFRWDVRNLQAGPTEGVLGTDLHNAGAGLFDATSRDRTMVIAYRWFGMVGKDRVEGTMVIRGDPTWTALTDHLEPFRLDSYKAKQVYGVDFDTGSGDIYVAYDTDWNDDRTIDGFTLDNTLTPVWNAGLIRQLPATVGSWNVPRLGVVVEQGGHRAWCAWEIFFNTTFGMEDSLNGCWFDILGNVWGLHQTHHLGLLSKPWIHDGKVYTVAHIERDLGYNTGIQPDPVDE